jgi:hypothetical protein
MEGLLYTNFFTCHKRYFSCDKHYLYNNLNSDLVKLKGQGRNSKRSEVQSKTFDLKKNLTIKGAGADISIITSLDLYDHHQYQKNCKSESDNSIIEGDKSVIEDDFKDKVQISSR